MSPLAIPGGMDRVMEYCRNSDNTIQEAMSVLLTPDPGQRIRSFS
jgi:hypothetical protein